ncbi:MULTISPECIES: PGN_0703 family putative restriction endonuclease [Psychrilyobacter]|uniref:Uncharacterized protein n=1 Tax=Psychrilyobacter piezotolerans TaxID=2293438 RepID=A0ABX9KLH0_9FUSO|nr:MULTISPECIES: hypothetical protein [Psychrilyobacter]MCS5422307.1 hypothetical protein [Psychrilyobacter sp. S5]NDI76507.1 hypothetical protein [Psychrilyobacter piezotolerans]RDE66098.1 hypothetical protein DV867_01075 [Psychrilyobacter sp. S5]REI43276.1 hypothetical protein DYH56_01075 [Psychrilyobacter piezotolerans]
MKSGEFNKKVKNHLGEFSTKLNLGVTSIQEEKLKEFIIYNGEKYDYILSDKLCVGFNDNKYSEIVYFDTYRKEILELIKSEKIKLHNFQKHLNSSQSMAINFFLPIKIEKNEKDMCEFIFGIKDIVSLKLEVSMNDSGGGESQTEVDCLLTENKGIQHLFEIKYTENSFGKVKNESKYESKWFGIPNEKHNLNMTNTKVQYDKVIELFNEDTVDYEFFLKNYQLVRNLYNTFFELKNNVIVKKENIGTMNCIISKRNDTQYKEFIKFRKNIKIEYFNKINLYYWEDVNQSILKISEKYQNKKLKDHYERFQKIYLDFK